MPRPISIPLLAALVAGVLGSSPAQAATSLYPDLETFSPREMQFQNTDVSVEGGQPLHHVLRFTNTVLNAGEGRLELRGQIDPITKAGPAIQRVYDSSGGYTDHVVGQFYYHVPHHHWHFDDWGSYQLWPKAEYQAWKSRGGSEDEAARRGTKTTSCVMDEEFVADLPATPFPGRYPSGGCAPNSSGMMIQGLSPGWGDTYDYYRSEQWIDLGPAAGSASPGLADGDYVLRSVTDPKNNVYESAGKADATREGIADNEATAELRIADGRLVDTTRPSGTVVIDDLASATRSTEVRVKAIGRDDVSGVDQVRLSNDGEHWSDPKPYTSTGSTPTSYSWDLTDSNYGGSADGGAKTVYVQFHDASGKLSEAESDTIVLEAPGPSSSYSAEVLDDSPAGYWRLGERGGNLAANSAGAGNHGTFVGAPTLGVQGLIETESGTAAGFDGTRQHVQVPSSSSLSPQDEVGVEAWIRPAALPAAGAFASVASKPGAYALQFNGQQLEFTVIQGGVSRRAQAAPGRIQPGRAYHVVGTYDGSSVRLYIDGTEAAALSASGPIDSSSSALSLASWSGSDEFFAGVVDDVAVYGTALSPARVKAHRAAGVPEPPPPPVVPPVAAPSGLSAVAESASQIDLSWSDNSSNESKFLLQRSTSPSFAQVTAIPIVENAVSYRDTGLVPGTTYYYRLRALNSASLAESPWSGVASARTPGPAAPVVVAVAPPPEIELDLRSGKRTVRVTRGGRLGYAFRATPGTAGAARFATARAVWVSRKHKRRVTFAAKSFRVPGSGKVELRIRLTRAGLAILRRNRRLTLSVRVALFGRNVPVVGTRKLTLLAPRR